MEGRREQKATRFGMRTKTKCLIYAGFVAAFLIIDAVNPDGWVRGVAGCRPYDAQLEVAWRKDRRDAFSLMDHKRYGEAEDKFRSALRLAEEQYGPEHDQVIKTINALATACVMQEKLPEAEALCKRSLRLSKKLYKGDDPRLCVPLLGLYEIAYESGHYAIAEDYAKQKLDIAEAAFGKTDPRLVEYLDDLSSCYGQQRLFDKAIAVCERMLKLLRQRPDGSDRLLGVTLSRLAFFYQSLGKYGDAEPLYLRSLEILKRVGPGEGDDIELSATVRNYSQLLRATNRPAEAKKLEAQYGHH